ncbi:immunity protein Imm33 domain-containing protein [Rufibacter hautae]|uniref:Imm33-like domain-containing protein n=1 Tax=Rufibacter hautae TaxID=2595005 RepID=A0A5B6TP91_9BACT|nr:hypothetical protein [Rufibacter hautae]KAA3438233.1 hypothetical protein FOA19_13305 [Rufibacter hautae]
MKTWIQIEAEQKEICKKLDLTWTPVDERLMIAINKSIFSNVQPINGLRHPKQESISGWYLWSGGEIPQDDNNFFQPIHPIHLIERREIILKYLGLPVGWRFQIDDRGYEDVWFDEEIIIE